MCPRLLPLFSLLVLPNTPYISASINVPLSTGGADNAKSSGWKGREILKFSLLSGNWNEFRFIIISVVVCVDVITLKCWKSSQPASTKLRLAFLPTRYRSCSEWDRTHTQIIWKVTRSEWWWRRGCSIPQRAYLHCCCASLSHSWKCIIFRCTLAGRLPPSLFTSLEHHQRQ